MYTRAPPAPHRHAASPAALHTRCPAVPRKPPPAPPLPGLAWHKRNAQAGEEVGHTITPVHPCARRGGRQSRAICALARVPVLYCLGLWRRRRRRQRACARASVRARVLMLTFCLQSEAFAAADASDAASDAAKAPGDSRTMDHSALRRRFEYLFYVDCCASIHDMCVDRGPTGALLHSCAADQCQHPHCAPRRAVSRALAFLPCARLRVFCFDTRPAGSCNAIIS